MRFALVEEGTGHKGPGSELPNTRFVNTTGDAMSCHIFWHILVQKVPFSVCFVAPIHLIVEIFDLMHLYTSELATDAR